MNNDSRISAANQPGSESRHGPRPELNQLIHGQSQDSVQKFHHNPLINYEDIVIAQNLTTTLHTSR